jgi:hypothetical protein
MKTRFLLAIGAIVMGTLSTATTAAAIGVSGPQPFGLAPAPAPGGQPRSYFTFQLEPGQARTDAIVIGNEGSSPQTFALAVAKGATATNSGSTFPADSAACTGAGCWITGLPSRITLPAHREQRLPFHLAVPRAAPQQEYLAGITAGPAAPLSPVNLSPNGQSRAVVIEQVTIGVEIIVGDAARMRNELDIPNVTATMLDGTLPRLLVNVDNHGQTILRAHGTASCAPGGKPITEPVYVSTVLPGDGAQIPVNVLGLHAGVRTHCSVILPYAGHLTAQWSGLVEIPQTASSVAPPQSAVAPLGSIAAPPPAKSAARQSGLPTWALTLIAALAALALGMLVALILILRRRPRPTEDSAEVIDVSDSATATIDVRNPKEEQETSPEQSKEQPQDP